MAGSDSIYNQSPYGTQPITSVQNKQKSDITSAVQNVAASGGATTSTAAKNTVSPYGTPLAVDDKGNITSQDIYVGAGNTFAYMTQAEAEQAYYQWDSKTKNKFLSQLQLAGYDTGSLKDAQVAQLWAGYVDAAASYLKAGKKVSPWDVLSKDMAQNESSKPRTVTQTQKTYNISTAEDAAALFQGAAQTLLGRDPTKAEQARFKSVLNKYEQAHPATTTTTSDYTGQDLTNQTSTTTGGVSADTQNYIASEEAKKNPEYGAYQAATNGMNWLLEAIGG